jgi:aminoglycoside 2''-phosphotransferase
MARQLGRLLSELHRFPPERAAELGVPTYSTAGWAQLYSELRETCGRDVSPLLSREERTRVAVFWRSFLDDDRYVRFQPVLIHADLGLDHILVDEQRATITGVIDFGDAVVGDPALDFVGFDEALRQDVLSNYDLTIDETLLDRAAWYWQVGPFYEVLYGLQIGEPKYVESGLEGIRERVILGSKKHR